MEKRHVQYVGVPMIGTTHRENMSKRLAAYRERMRKAGRRGERK